MKTKEQEREMITIRRVIKEEKGITLVALIVTIIILIILAGITISLSLEEDGIINHAREAKEQYQNAQQYEEVETLNYSNVIDEIVVGKTENNNSNHNFEKSEYITDIKFDVSEISAEEFKVTVDVSTTDETKVLGYHYMVYEENNINKNLCKMSKEKEIFITGLNGNSEYTIYVVGYDIYNNCIYSSEKKVKTLSTFDVFEIMNKKSRTLSYYGVTYSLPNNEFPGFGLNNLRYGHQNGRGNYHGYYILPFEKFSFSKINIINVEFMQRTWKGNADGGYVQTSIQLFYTDGTYDEIINPKHYSSWNSVTAELKVDVSKEMDYLKMNIYGYDGYDNEMEAYVKNINFIWNE